MISKNQVRCRGALVLGARIHRAHIEKADLPRREWKWHSRHVTSGVARQRYRYPCLLCRHGVPATVRPLTWYRRTRRFFRQQGDRRTLYLGQNARPTCVEKNNGTRSRSKGISRNSLVRLLLSSSAIQSLFRSRWGISRVAKIHKRDARGVSRKARTDIVA